MQIDSDCYFSLSMEVDSVISTALYYNNPKIHLDELTGRGIPLMIAVERLVALYFLLVSRIILCYVSHLFARMIQVDCFLVASIDFQSIALIACFHAAEGFSFVSLAVESLRS